MTFLSNTCWNGKRHSSVVYPENHWFICSLSRESLVEKFQSSVFPILCLFVMVSLIEVKLSWLVVMIVTVMSNVGVGSSLGKRSF